MVCPYCEPDRCTVTVTLRARPTIRGSVFRSHERRTDMATIPVLLANRGSGSPLRMIVGRITEVSDTFLVLGQGGGRIDLHQRGCPTD